MDQGISPCAWSTETLFSLCVFFAIVHFSERKQSVNKLAGHTTTTRTTSPGPVDRARRDENVSQQETTDFSPDRGPRGWIPGCGRVEGTHTQQRVPHRQPRTTINSVVGQNDKPYRVPTILHQTQLMNSGKWGQLTRAVPRRVTFLARADRGRDISGGNGVYHGGDPAIGSRVL